MGFRCFINYGLQRWYSPRFVKFVATSRVGACRRSKSGHDLRGPLNSPACRRRCSIGWPGAAVGKFPLDRQHIIRRGTPGRSASCSGSPGRFGNSRRGLSTNVFFFQAAPKTRRALAQNCFGAPARRPQHLGPRLPLSLLQRRLHGVEHTVAGIAERDGNFVVSISNRSSTGWHCLLAFRRRAWRS